MVIKSYQLGNCTIKITSPAQMRTPLNLEKFRIENGSEKNCITYIVSVCEDMDTVWNFCNTEEKSPRCMAVREDLKVIQNTDGECRFLNFKGDNRCYAASVQTGERSYQIIFARWVETQLVADTIFLAPFALERQMIRDGSLILHSAFIQYKGRAVLFSAPSGIGKSTQAGLWEKYMRTETVNGDRALLVRRKNGWYAEGWPVCGSSEICKNQRWPVQAIVMLGQSAENKVKALKGMQAFREVMPQITVNRWNRDMQNSVLDSMEMLLNEIPVCRLMCSISEEAVRCLEKYLMEICQ